MVWRFGRDIVASDLSLGISTVGGRLEVAYKSAHIPAKIVMSSGVNLWQRG